MRINMIINRDLKLEENIFSRLSQIDSLINNKDMYALGLRFNAFAALCKALRSDEAVKALTDALDKVLALDVLNTSDEADLKKFMIGNALYTAYDFTGDDKYRQAAIKLAADFKKLSRNDNGCFNSSDNKRCLCKAYQYEPFYMAYETKDGGKEQYNDVIAQYNAMHEELFATVKYQEDRKTAVGVLAIYAASLIDTMEVMDQMIYEIYRKMQDYYKASVNAVLASGYSEDGMEQIDTASELMFAYAILKGCRMKALHTEKYEGIVLGVCDKVMSGEIFTGEDEEADDTSLSIAALVYSETVRNREYQDYGRGKGGALWS